MRSVEMFLIRALVWKLSVVRPIWAPVKLIAGTPRLSMAIAMRATLTCSPVESSMSISRRGAVGDLAGQGDQFVGRAPPGGNDDQHLIAPLVRLDRPPRRGQDLVGIGDAGAAELLYEQ